MCKEDDVDLLVIEDENTEKNVQKVRPELNFDNKPTEKVPDILENTESDDRSSFDTGTSNTDAFVPAWKKQVIDTLKARGINTDFLEKTGD